MTSPAPSPRRSRPSLRRYPRQPDAARPPADPAHDEPGAAPGLAHDEAVARPDGKHHHPRTAASRRAGPRRAPRSDAEVGTPRSGVDVRTVTFGAVAWLVVLAAVAGVQVSRRAWPDSIVLLTVLGVLVVDLTGSLRHGTVTASRAGPAVVGAAVLVGLVLVVAPRHGTVAGLAVVASGAAALAYAWPDRADGGRTTRDRVAASRVAGSRVAGDRAAGDTAGDHTAGNAASERPAWDRPTSRTAFAWSAAWIAACLWELAMFILGSHETDGRNLYPAASDILDPLLDNPLAKALFVVVWLAAGVGLLARTDRR
jgi:hypothetical protein